MRYIIFSLLALALLFPACRKNEYITTDANAKLTLSKDSILFDTIFTGPSSTVRKIKVFNENDDALRISEIKLSGGNASPFSVNINGENTLSKRNLILNGKDSLNIFIKATINPDAKNNAFLVQDSIILTSNGNRQVIQLLAYGQNAVFINNGVINTNTIWTKNLPYLINGTVLIKMGANLTIQPGAKIYFHKDAAMTIEGTLNANGTFDEPIEFCSDRLEPMYKDEPGQWKGISFRQTGTGIINNAIVKNASVGITSDSLTTNTNPKLIISNSTIKNMQVAAYIGYHSELMAFNNLMHNCGNYLIYATGGGNYNLKQNTFAAYNPDFPRKTAALTFSDYLSEKVIHKLTLDLTNNIIWGSLTNELDIQRKSAIPSQNSITTNLIKTNSSNYNTGNIINSDPLFMSVISGNFMLMISSPAVKKGIDLSNDSYFNTYLNKDLKDKTRIFPSSIGCYEKY